MIVTMCENNSDSKVPMMRSLYGIVSKDVVTVNCVNNNVEILKLKCKKLIHESEIHSIETVVRKDDTKNESEPEQNSKSLCLSAETLIEKLDTAVDLIIDSNPTLQISWNKSGPECSFVLHGINNVVTSPTTNVSSGLLISPSLLPQDICATVCEDKQRMSAVLDSLDLHHVYIPLTQQLVATKKTNSKMNHISSENNALKNSKEDKSETDSSGYMSNPYQAQDSHGSCPAKMNFSITNSTHSIHVLSPETSNISESEFLNYVREPDGSICGSSDYVCNFPMMNTNESLLRTFSDVSSLSSLSTGTEFSVSAASLDDGDGTGHCIDTGDVGFMEINLHSRNSYEYGNNQSHDSGFDDKSTKPKRKGLYKLLSRGLFSWKSKEHEVEEQPGWKLFGEISPKPVPDQHLSQMQTEYKVLKQRDGQHGSDNGHSKKDITILSTTALILENRPMNLPCKNRDEMERHQKEYETMVEAAKRKEQKEIKQKKKQLQHQLQLEERLMNTIHIWTKQILPNWDTMISTKKTKELWWHGIPPNVRGKVWKLALGNDLNITPELYEICVSRAADKIKQMAGAPMLNGVSETVYEPTSSKESSIELIKLDVSRTFPQLCIFQKGGPYHDLLHSLLVAYACYRPDVGYVQGMSFIAAVFLLNMEVADAFICFANLLNHPCQVAFFRLDEGMMRLYFQTYEEFFKENMLSLHQHFHRNNLTPDLYLYDWIFALFTKSMPLDVACRVWDVFCRDGEEFLFRTALGILKCHEDVLMQMDFIHLAQFLTKLPECDSYEHLFTCIKFIHMTIDKKKFSQVMAHLRDDKEVTW